MGRFAELSALEAEVLDLNDRLDTRKAVDRAKSMLQEELSLTEPDAFRWIQKTAMDLRLSMRQVAEGVVEHGVADVRLRRPGRRVVDPTGVALRFRSRIGNRPCRDTGLGYRGA